MFTGHCEVLKEPIPPPPKPAPPKPILQPVRPRTQQARGPGRKPSVLHNLKTGRLPEVLAAAVDGPRAEAAAALTAHWEGWEQGTTVPLEVAEGLRDVGLAAFLADLTEG